MPNFVSLGNIIIPELSLPTPSSVSEHNIPLDSIPLILPFFITKSSLSLAPTCAIATISPSL